MPSLRRTTIFNFNRFKTGLALVFLVLAGAWVEVVTSGAVVLQGEAEEAWREASEPHSAVVAKGAMWEAFLKEFRPEEKVMVPPKGKRIRKDAQDELSGIWFRAVGRHTLQGQSPERIAQALGDTLDPLWDSIPPLPPKERAAMLAALGKAITARAAIGKLYE